MENIIYNVKLDVLKFAIAKTGKLKVKLSGNSMKPNFLNGQIVEIIPVSIDALQVGDCLLYLCETHGLVFHRIMELGLDDVLLKGDNSTNNERIEKKQIIGVYTAINYANCNIINGDIALLLCIYGFSLELVVESYLLKKMMVHNNNDS